MKNIKKLVSDIHAGKNIKTNLEVYRDLAIGTYHDYASLELVFSSYMLMEECAEVRPELSAKEQTILTELREGLAAIHTQDADLDSLIGKMKQIRETITGKMDLFTTYTDQLICYEYVLNRMELTFVPPKELDAILAKYPEDAFMQQIMLYLFSTQDQAVITENIRTVVGQLPVRTTKTKFFEKLTQALTLYKGGDKSSLDSFVYMLRTSGLVYEANEYQDEYREFGEFTEQLASTDYASLSEEEYNLLVEQLQKMAEQIHEITDFYYSIQKVANSIYAVAVCRKYDEGISTTVTEAQKVLGSILKEEATDEMLVPLEGRIEQYAMESSYLEAILFEIRSAYQTELSELNYIELFDDLVSVANLLSGSLFVNVEQEDTQETVTDAYVQEVTDLLVDEVTKRFAKVSKPVKRGMMGMMLEKLPMIFSNSDQVKEHIQTNLFGCTDKVEKAAVLDILSNVMKED